MAAENNYVIGQGKLYLDAFQKVNGVYVPGTKTGEVFVGDCPSFSIEISTENKEYWSSTKAVKTKERNVGFQVDYKAMMETGDVSFDNLAIAFLGSISTVATSTATITGEALTSSAIAGAEYQIGASLTNPTGVRNLDQFTTGSVDVVVKSVAPAATLTAGTDYTVDLILGRVKILNTAAAVGKSLTVDYKTKAASRSRVIAASDKFNGSLRYIADNVAGNNRDVYIPYVELSPKGEFAFIGDDWQKIGFDININALSGYNKVYIDGRAV